MKQRIEKQIWYPTPEWYHGPRWYEKKVKEAPGCHIKIQKAKENDLKTANKLENECKRYKVGVIHTLASTSGSGREFIVDAGASFHLIGRTNLTQKKDLGSEKLIQS